MENEISTLQIEKKIYVIRGVQVMLDFDLAEIYGYETRDFNKQVKNNIKRFDEDFRFQLTQEEFDEINLMWKISTSSWGGTRKLPYAFTEQGIYMLMTVLRGDLAVSQSKALIRIFKQMKDIIIQSQNILSSPELVKLSLQTAENTRQIAQTKKDVEEIKNKMVTKHALSKVMKDFTDPNINVDFKMTKGIYHDRYIFIDYGTKTEKVFHCGGSSKDGGTRTMSISQVEDTSVYQKIAADLLKNPPLVL